MEFFDKLRLTLSSPLKSHSSDRDSRDFKTWTLPAQNFKIDNIRLLLYRDCDRRGRKCLFDSAHVVKDAKTGKFIYLPVTNTGQVKDLSEWIFGCVPLSSSSTKRFHRCKGNFVWSKTFQAPATIRNRNSNSSSHSRNVYSGSSSCLSSNDSSGYCSGIDDSSYEQSSTDSSRNWSLPIMNPTSGSSGCEIKMSNSLPSRLTLEAPNTKMLLGLAIVISTGSDDEDDDDGDKDKSREICDRKQLPTYITSISSTMESSTDWFSMISIQSHLNPPTFVETLYNFSEEFRQLFLSRLTTPLANVNNIPLTVKYLPSSIEEFLTVYMTHDLSWIKCHSRARRCRVVIIASPKKVQEVKSIFTMLKLINQCSCTKSFPPPSSASSLLSLHPETVTTSLEGCHDDKVQHQQNTFSLTPSSDTPKTPTPATTSAAITICVKSDEESPTKDEIGLDVVNLNPEDFIRKTEDCKFLTRESTRDSGISSILSSTTSLKRSSTSRKFMGNLPSSIDSLDSGKNMELDYGVYFHLGEESDTEQTFNNLGLSEPCPEKLKQSNYCNSNSGANSSSIITTANISTTHTSSNNNNNSNNNLIFNSLGSEGSGEGGSTSSSNKMSPVSFTISSNNNDDDEPIEENYDSFDMLDDVNNILSNTTLEKREPIHVDLNVSTTKVKIVKFCTYCDSISIVDKFNPLFQVQWLKCSPNNSSSSSTSNSNNTNNVSGGNNNNSTTSTSSTGSSSSSFSFQVDSIPGDSFKYLEENWIVYNVDKQIIKFFNGSSKQENNLSANPPSNLVTNLVEHVQVLMNNSKESEIEQFVNIQLDFIRKLGEEFGTKLMNVTKFDVQSMPYVGENDLNLLFAVASSRFSELNQRFFV